LLKNQHELQLSNMDISLVKHTTKKEPVIGWAKTTKDGEPGLSVLDHCRNVGWVAYYLAKAFGEGALKDFLNPLDAAAAAACHDVGKLSKGFLSKCPIWLEQEGLLDQSLSERWIDLNSNHGAISQYSVFRALRKAGLKNSSSRAWAIIGGAHHGRVSNTPTTDEVDDWEVYRQNILKFL
jgi:CRISPR-associated endonuclease/helicase Cas3